MEQQQTQCWDFEAEEFTSMEISRKRSSETSIESCLCEVQGAIEVLARKIEIEELGPLARHSANREMMRWIASLEHVKKMMQ